MTVRENDAVWMMMIWDIKSTLFFSVSLFPFHFIPFYHFQFIDQINNRHIGNTIFCEQKEQINAINSLLLILYLFDFIFKTKIMQDFHTNEEERKKKTLSEIAANNANWSNIKHEKY